MAVMESRVPRTFGFVRSSLSQETTGSTSAALVPVTPAGQGGGVVEPEVDAVEVARGVLVAVAVVVPVALEVAVAADALIWLHGTVASLVSFSRLMASWATTVLMITSAPSLTPLRVLVGSGVEVGVGAAVGVPEGVEVPVGASAWFEHASVSESAHARTARRSENGN